MEKLLEKTYYLAGNNNYYQYRTLLIALFFWIFANVLPSSLAFFESMPYVDVYSYKNNSIIQNNIKLNYTICNSEELYYKVIKFKEYSIIQQFDFDCNQNLVSLLSSVVFAGGSVGSMMLQIITNYLGRKVSFLFALIMLFLSFVLFMLRIHFIWVYIFFFLLQLFIIMLAYGSIINIAETCCADKRPFFISIVNCGYSISGLVFTVVYYFDITWKLAIIVSCAFMIFFTLCFKRLTVNSPRSYVAIGDYINFYNSIRYISKINHRWIIIKSILPIPIDLHNQLNTPVSQDEDHIEKKSILEFYEPLLPHKDSKRDVQLLKKEINNVLSKRETSIMFEDLVYDHFKKDAVIYNQNEISDLIKLIRYKSQRSIFIITCFSWFCVTGIYYSLSLFLKKLPGSIYLNALLLYGVEFISYFSGTFILNYCNIGRKYTLQFYLLISLLCSILLTIIKIETIKESYFFFVILLIFRFSIAGAHNINFIYSLEVYPTLLRLTGFGINCNMGCFSAVLFPLFIEADYHEKMFQIFIILILLLLAIIWLLPETKDLVLTNIIPEESSICEHRGTQLYIKKRSDIKLKRKLSYFDHSLIECNENINIRKAESYIITDNEDNNNDDSVIFLKSNKNNLNSSGSS